MSKKKSTKQNEWCVVAEVPQNTIFMMSRPIRNFFDIWPKVGLGNKIHKYFTLYNGDFSQMCYLRKEFDEEADFLADKMIKNPVWALKVIDKVEEWSKDFFKLSKKQRSVNLRDLSDKKLIEVFNLTKKVHILSHGIGSSVSWHADAEKERVTKAITKMIDEQVKKRKLKLVAPVVLSILSTPLKISIVEQEEINFLKIAQVINKKAKVKVTFKQSNLDSLVKNLKSIDKDVYSLIIRHYNKFRWLPYQYKGPAYDLADFVGRWQAIAKSNNTPRKEINKIINKRKKLIKEQRDLLKKLRFSNYQLNLIKLSQKMVYIKDFRKMSLYHGCYSYEGIFREAGDRLGLSLEQVRAMNAWEIPQALLKNKFNIDELNSRLVECAAYYDGKKYKVYVGRGYKKFIKKVKFEKSQVAKSDELTGTCACPGKARGIVKVINVPEEMGKMEEGDILVAHNTNPNLVPAMKKAAALISGAGGLTCHTAIVARELKVPSIVGVTAVDKILKDGDKVEVDATNGIIRKMK